MGLGNPLGRDDALGFRLAECFKSPEWITIPTQSLENALGLIEKLAPELLVVVDAAEMGLPPGSFRRLPLPQGTSMLGSTHGLPLSLLLTFIGVTAVVVIGVEPKERGLGEELSPEVREALAQLMELLRDDRIAEIPKLIPEEKDEP